MGRRGWALLLALLLVAPVPAGAAAGRIAELTASTAFAADANARGPLAVAAFIDDRGEATPSMQGSGGEVEVRTEGQVVYAGYNGQLGSHKDRDPQVEQRRGATIATTWPQQQHEAHLFPLPGSPAPTLTVTGGCLDLEPAEPRTVRTTPNASTATSPDPSATTEGTYSLRPCPSHVLRVEGDFLVVLWGADVAVTDANGTTQTWSGSRPEPNSGDEPTAGLPPPLDTRREQKVFLTVHGGALSLHWGAAGLKGIYAAAVEVETPALTLRGASGTLQASEGPRSVTARQLVLEGTLAASFGPPQDSAVAVVVSGTPTGGQIDGAPLGWVVAAEPQAFQWGLLLLVVGSVAVPAVGGVASHRAWSRRSLESLEALLAARRDDAVVRRSRVLVRWSPFRTEALLLRIEALLRQGKAGQAFEDLRELPPAVRDGPVGQFLRGHILAAAGQARAGAGNLARAAAAGPEFAARIAGDPLYLEARGEDSLRAALAGGRP